MPESFLPVRSLLHFSLLPDTNSPSHAQSSQWFLFPHPPSKMTSPTPSIRQGPYASGALMLSPPDHVGFSMVGINDHLYYSSSCNSGGRPSTAHSEDAGASNELHGTPIAPPESLCNSLIPLRVSSKKYRGRRVGRRPRREIESNADPSVEWSTSTAPSQPDSDLSSCETYATSLPPLQTKGALDKNDILQPLAVEDIDPASFDLVAPPKQGKLQYSLETRSEELFSAEHLRIIFSDSALLLKFTAFLSAYRPRSVPILTYYLNAIKALKAISYSNALISALDPIPGYNVTTKKIDPTINASLEERSILAFNDMVRDDLPAYITYLYIKVATISIERKITGTLASHLRDASEGLAEVFCLTDPSRPGNPIVFASKEFHQTTQYGMDYVIGRNCRFLQGPKTNPFSVKRLREKIDAGQEHCEVFLNYRRDGSPFMNLLMVAPLRDSRGNVRYFIGAQVDVSGLVKECTGLESLRRLVDESSQDRRAERFKEAEGKKDEFQQLSEMLNMHELDIVRRWGGQMHKEYQEEVQENNGNGGNWRKPGVLIHDLSPDARQDFHSTVRQSGKLSGVYENYLLVRPYPSLKILFSSPSLRLPGMIQSSFIERIGENHGKRDKVTRALADGRGFTANVRWVSKHDAKGRDRWVHCTPLIGSNGVIGVWVVVIVEDGNSTPPRKLRQAPPVDPRIGRPITARDCGPSLQKSSDSLDPFNVLSGAQGGIFGSTRPARSGGATCQTNSSSITGLG